MITQILGSKPEDPVSNRRVIVDKGASYLGVSTQFIRARSLDVNLREERAQEVKIHRGRTERQTRSQEDSIEAHGTSVRDAARTAS